MNKNQRIAKELVKLAKLLIATEDKTSKKMKLTRPAIRLIISFAFAICRILLCFYRYYA